jgi:hypothetical protein
MDFETKMAFFILSLFFLLAMFFLIYGNFVLDQAL